MKKKYITNQMLLAFQAKPKRQNEDIYTQLAETIAERQKLIPEWEKIFETRPKPVIEKDIHSQLAETIAQYKQMKQQLYRQEDRFEPGDISAVTGKKAA